MLNVFYLRILGFSISLLNTISVSLEQKKQPGSASLRSMGFALLDRFGSSHSVCGPLAVC